MNVRPARQADRDAVLPLAETFATSFVVDGASFRSSFEAVVLQPSACLLVAEAGSDVIGYVLGFEHPSFFANGRVAWVEELMVSEELRRRGVGKRLMEAFARWARERECRLIALATRRAADFYEGIGYERSAMYFRKFL